MEAKWSFIIIREKINRQGPKKKGTTHTTTTPKVFLFLFFLNPSITEAHTLRHNALRKEKPFFYFHSSGGNDKRNQYVGAQCAIPDVVCAYIS